MSGGAADGKIGGCEEDWQGVEGKANADGVGVSELPMRISREAGSRGSPRISGTEAFVTVPTLGGSIENGCGGVPVF